MKIFSAKRGRIETPFSGKKFKQYRAQIARMSQNARAWRLLHPGSVPQVQFNFTENVMMIMPISIAVEKHFVSCNAEGLEMIKAMWPWDDSKEPTVTMVKIAIEVSV